jgi:putative transposase
MLAQSLGPSDPFFAYPNEIRKIIYTTNAIESLHMQLKRQVSY